MYCANCGKEIDDRAVICPYCGVATGKTANANASTENNTMAIVGFVFSFFIPFIGLICSIIGLKKSTDLNGKGKGLAIAGLIISIISIAITLIVLMTSMSAIMAIIAEMPESGY